MPVVGVSSTPSTTAFDLSHRSRIHAFAMSVSYILRCLFAACDASMEARLKYHRPHAVKPVMRPFLTSLLTVLGP